MTRSNPQSLSVYLVFELVRCYLNFQLELQRSLYRYKRSLSVQMRFPIVNNIAEVSYGQVWTWVNIGTYVTDPLTIAICTSKKWFHYGY